MTTKPETTQAETHRLPNEGTYFSIFVLLAGLTLTELLVTYIPGIKVPLLLGLAATKAWLVVQFYMHLRYDSRIFSWALLLPVMIGILMTIFLQVLVR
jgi:cytochrome c oxidase subunit IV